MEMVQKGVKESFRRSQEARWAACPTLLSRFALHTLCPLAANAYGFAILSCDVQLAAACMGFKTAHPLPEQAMYHFRPWKSFSWGGRAIVWGWHSSGTHHPAALDLEVWCSGPQGLSSVLFPSESEQADLGTGLGWGSELAPLTITPHRKRCFFLPLLPCTWYVRGDSDKRKCTSTREDGQAFFNSSVPKTLGIEEAMFLNAPIQRTRDTDVGSTQNSPALWCPLSLSMGNYNHPVRTDHWGWDPVGMKLWATPSRKIKV